MKYRLATLLVRHTAYAIDQSYKSYVLNEKYPKEGFDEAEKYWSEVFRWRSKYLIPIASFLSNEATGREMVRQGWWG